jgi:hypothetical protein
MELLKNGGEKITKVLTTLKIAFFKETLYRMR